jgi:hypothetical protein
MAIATGTSIEARISHLRKLGNARGTVHGVGVPKDHPDEP